MTTSDAWNQTRREAEITIVEFADFVGIRRDYAHKMETGRVIATASDWTALRAMIAERAAA